MIVGILQGVLFVVIAFIYIRKFIHITVFG